MLTESVTTDIVVVGGGLAGVSAAIGAARQGSRVVLVQNRPVLGGNSSSEVRVWVCGATAHGIHLFARETGVMGELFVENQFRNPDGNPYYWDMLLLEKVKAESNIELFLNTEVIEVEADGPRESREIHSVTGWMSGSERRITLTAPTFIDCSGDGLVGDLAGAESMRGSEPRESYGESWAPEEPGEDMLGSTILFYTKDVGHPQKFVAPPFAIDIAATSIPQNRVIRQSMNGCDYWWIEWGGELDVVHDNERIRDELQAVCYGIWDYIKNSGLYAAENLSLEWVGAVPGKREYRRFVGDHLLTQHDVLGQTEFEDRIAFGGWSIDLHPVGGVYASEKGSRHWHPEGNYHIPLRSLYSRNVTNLWMAGRDISASHVAFGSTRVMATCAVLGEAAGIAASVADQLSLTPRQLASDHVHTLHRAMVRADASLLGVADDDPENLALIARAQASSTATRLASERSSGQEALVDDLALVLPVDPALGAVELLVDAEEDTELELELHSVSRPQNYLPSERERHVVVPVVRGRSWARADLDWTPEQAQNAVLVLRRNSRIAVHRGVAAQPGTVTLRHRELPDGERNPDQWRHWKETLHGQGICFRTLSATEAFAAQKAVGGYARPYGGPNLWISDVASADPQPWLELRWTDTQEVACIEIVLDDDLNEDLINLHHHRTPSDTMPTLVRNARIEALEDEVWREIARLEDNRERRRRLVLENAVTTTAIRLVVEDTNGVEEARVVALRAYRVRP
ncbi:pyridine nucleotide-disulfide oxidoreductase [Brachybacterium endophyticum]|uniref:Pyridine nucleotide-disulfide oxidoreductase n=1 Tax=Brachybacterium endophyticum TaxID=2182385 RepID=A0A2U2RHE0_9MICO|nr:FAD-dependent oxidoreductase [Brachybacterium endophyticum]PWH05277.1 pyridine nucleotide-disulfide oxidoreductase [Brachybacterium endophyticum]